VVITIRLDKVKDESDGKDEKESGSFRRYVALGRSFTQVVAKCYFGRVWGLSIIHLNPAKLVCTTA
jgi:hypothetical protein